jgi:hypothetical protein
MDMWDEPFTSVEECESRWLGNDVALERPAIPAVINLTVGGSIRASDKIMIAVSGRSTKGYFEGGIQPGRAIDTAIATTGATSSLAASIPPIRGAVAYDWFFSSDDGATYFYAGTTITGSFTFTSTLTANVSVESSGLRHMWDVAPKLTSSEHDPAEVR